MRITEKDLHEACKEINDKLAKIKNAAVFSVRNLSGGGGKLVEVTQGGRTTTITTIGESNREVHSYLQGIDDAIHNYAKTPKADTLVNLKYKTEVGNVFNNLFTRCLNHEFDLTVELEHIVYLSSDIDHAHASEELTAYEYGRLLEQYKILTATAQAQVSDGSRPAGNLDKFNTKK